MKKKNIYLEVIFTNLFRYLEKDWGFAFEYPL